MECMLSCRGTTSNISRRDSVAAQPTTPLLDTPSRLTSPSLTPAGAARPAGGNGGPGSSQRHQGLRLLWRPGSPHCRLPQAAQREQGSGAQQERLLWVWRVWWRDVAGWLLHMFGGHPGVGVAFVAGAIPAWCVCRCFPAPVHPCAIRLTKGAGRTAPPQSLSTANTTCVTWN